jgi:hypothetical protein
VALTITRSRRRKRRPESRFRPLKRQLNLRKKLTVREIIDKGLTIWRAISRCNTSAWLKQAQLPIVTRVTALAPLTPP